MTRTRVTPKTKANQIQPPTDHLFRFKFLCFSAETTIKSSVGSPFRLRTESIYLKKRKEKKVAAQKRHFVCLRTPDKNTNPLA